MSERRGENVFFTTHPEQNSAICSCSTTEGTGNWIYSICEHIAHKNSSHRSPFKTISHVCTEYLCAESHSVSLPCLFELAGAKTHATAARSSPTCLVPITQGEQMFVRTVPSLLLKHTGAVHPAQNEARRSLRRGESGARQ